MAFLEERKSKINKMISKAFADPSPLSEVLNYCLSGNSSRIRPILTHAIAFDLGDDSYVSQIALASEYFHTSSLIADDLPYMDNSPHRRSKVSTHMKFGERLAILASYALISEGFKQIDKGRKELSLHPALHKHSLEIASYIYHYSAKSSSVAVMGQTLDLSSKGLPINDLITIATMKSAKIFGGALLSGWLFGGGDMAQVHLVEELGDCIGLSYQIRDDCKDVEEDKKSGRDSIATAGIELATKLLKEKADKVIRICDRLSLPTVKAISKELFTTLR